MGKKFTKVMPNAWDHIQINAGVVVTGFDPTDGSYTGILGATGDGLTFNPNPSYEDFGSDIDNCPPNTKQLKRLVSYDPSLSGTFKTITQALAAMLGPGTLNSTTGAITPAMELTDAMFQDVTVIGDYSKTNTDVSTTQKAGWCAVTIKRALNITGYQWKTNKDGKGEFAFDFHGHYDLDNIDDPPFEYYVVEPVVPTT